MRQFNEFPFQLSPLPLGMLKAAELGCGLSGEQRFRHTLGRNQEAPGRERAALLGAPWGI